MKAFNKDLSEMTDEMDNLGVYSKRSNRSNRDRIKFNNINQMNSMQDSYMRQTERIGGFKSHGQKFREMYSNVKNKTAANNQVNTSSLQMS